MAPALPALPAPRPLTGHACKIVSSTQDPQRSRKPDAHGAFFWVSWLSARLRPLSADTLASGFQRRQTRWRTTLSEPADAQRRGRPTGSGLHLVAWFSGVSRHGFCISVYEDGELLDRAYLDVFFFFLFLVNCGESVARV